MGYGGKIHGLSAHRATWLIPVILSCCVLAALSACGGNSTQNLLDSPSIAPVAADSGFALPAPSELKFTSYEPQDLTCCGADYVLTPGFPVQNTSTDGECCTFSPNWTPDIHPPEGLAYACYTFGMEDYDRPHTVALTWEESGSPSDVWIGFADFNRDCWSWHQPPDGCYLSTDLSSYIPADTNNMLAIILFTGTSTWQLSRIKIGDLAALSGQVYESDGETPLFDAEVIASGASTYTARVDYEGNWTMPGVPPDGYDISAHLIGWHIAPAERNIIVNGVDVIVDQFIGTPLPTYTVSGRVLESPGMSGLRGVEVAITPQDGSGGSVSAWTGFEGEWYFGIPDGDYIATPSMAGWTFTPGTRQFTVNGTDTMVPDFHAEKLPSYVIDGYVYEADGVTPVENVQLNLSHLQFEIYYYASTDRDGYWHVDEALDGDYIVEPFALGWMFEPETREITVAGESLRVDPFLGTELGQFTVDGYVSLDDGVTPLADVDLQLTGPSGWYWDTTDYLGHYQFDNVYAGSDYNVVPQENKYDFTPDSYNFDVTGNITLDPFLATELDSYNVDGYIFKTGGTTPVVDAYVLVYPYMGSTAYEAYSDATGHWVATGVPPGTYGVWPQKQGYTFEPQDQQASVVDHDVTMDDFIGTSQPAYAMDGYIYETDGITPVPDVHVDVFSWAYVFEAVTDESGHWFLDEVFVETYEVTPSLAPWQFTPQSRTVEVSSSNVTVPNFLGVELEAYTVDGYVLELGTDEPVPLVELQCYDGSYIYYCETNAAGHYEILLPNGDWTVMPMPGCWDFTPYSQDITVDSAPQTLEIFYAEPGG